MIFSKEFFIVLLFFYFFTENYQLTMFIQSYNFIKSCFYLNREITDNIKDTDELKNDNDVSNKPTPKYEDKYLNDILKLDKEFQLDDNELMSKITKYEDYLSLLQNEKNKELKRLLNKVEELEEKILKYKNMDDDYCICNNDDEDYDLGETPDERIEILTKEKEEVLLNYNKLKDYIATTEFKEEIKNISNELSLKPKRPFGLKYYWNM